LPRWTGSGALSLPASTPKPAACSNDAAIARTLIGLSQSLGLDVIAEGVENEAQRDFLARHGCGFYQGFLFCAPLGITELEAFIAQQPKTTQGRLLV
jgi:EAL domain-containing protein (putative c-di-GMP-specific phosphodiesterase class I)